MAPGLAHRSPTAYHSRDGRLVGRLRSSWRVDADRRGHLLRPLDPELAWGPDPTHSLPERADTRDGLPAVTNGRGLRRVGRTTLLSPRGSERRPAFTTRPSARARARAEPSRPSSRRNRSAGRSPCRCRPDGRAAPTSRRCARRARGCARAACAMRALSGCAVGLRAAGSGWARAQLASERGAPAAASIAGSSSVRSMRLTRPRCCAQRMSRVRGLALAIRGTRWQPARSLGRGCRGVPRAVGRGRRCEAYLLRSQLLYRTAGGQVGVVGRARASLPHPSPASPLWEPTRQPGSLARCVDACTAPTRLSRRRAKTSRNSCQPRFETVTNTRKERGQLLERRERSQLVDGRGLTSGSSSAHSLQRASRGVWR